MVLAEGPGQVVSVAGHRFRNHLLQQVLKGMGGGIGLLAGGLIHPNLERGSGQRRQADRLRVEVFRHLLTLHPVLDVAPAAAAHALCRGGHPVTADTHPLKNLAHHLIALVHAVHLHFAAAVGQRP